MNRLIDRQIAKLRSEALACRQVASQISLRVAAEALLETGQALERQAAALEHLRENPAEGREPEDLSDCLGMSDGGRT